MKKEMIELEGQIFDMEQEIAALESKIEDFELDPYDFEDEYCEALDCEGSVTVCGIEFMPSDILKEMDPTAYRCGLIDYVDGMDMEDDENYQEMIEKRDEMQEELETLQEELDEMEEGEM